MLFLLAITGLAPIAFLIVRWPVQTTLGLYAFLLPFDAVLLAGEVGQIHLHLTWFVGAVACAVLLLTGLVSRGFLRPPRTALYWFLFALWAVTSSVWAINPRDSVFRSPVIALLLLIYVVAASLHITEQELTGVVWLAVLGGCAAAAITLYQFVQGTYWSPDAMEQLDPIEGLALARRAGLVLGDRVTNPNALAASLLLPLSLAMGLLLSIRSWLKRLLLMSGIALIGTCMILTMSRGAWVAMAVVVTVYLVRTWVDWRLAVPIVLMTCIVAAMPEVFLTRLEGAVEDRGAGRLDIWNAGLLAFRDHIIWGTGLDSFPAVADKYRYVAIHDLGAVARAPHNTYLGTGVELGAVGLGLLLAAVSAHLFAFTKVLRLETHAPRRLRLISYEAACWGLLVAAFFQQVPWEQYFWLAWILLMLGGRVSTVRINESCRAHAATLGSRAAKRHMHSASPEPAL